MTPKNEQRIEQIRRGEVPEGYKKTKVGIIPAEWKTTRFKCKFTRLTRKNTEGNTNVLTISAQYGLVNQEEFFNKSVASDDKSNYYLLNRGEYAYNKSYSNGYPFGAIKRLDKYQKGVVSPLYICFSASEDNKCPDFYLQYFESGKMNSEIQAFAQEGARNHGLLNISVDDFFNSIIVEPPIPEQERIAEILSAQDRVIELCEKKVEQLKKLKKVFLQKMFPKPGKNVPEWRFPGFTDAWEQRKLGEVLVEYNDTCENDGTFEHVSLTTQGVVPKTKRYDRDQLVKHDDKKYRVTHANDICYNPANLKFGVICRNKYGDGIFSPIYVTFKVKDDTLPSFIETVVTRYDFIEKALQYQQGTVYERMAVGPETLLKIEVALPDIKEQKTIGMFFESLDNLITLHQRKCDEEKQKKKALMQLLLTGIVRTV